VGLVPLVGDLVGVILSSTILAEAARLGVGRGVLLRMALNVAIEGVAGAVPLAGDLFDAAWKANQRNVRLLERWMEAPRRAERASVALVAGLALGLLALVVGALLLMVLALRWLVACC
jgi:uncharacterized iron-regulated membrane protein